MIYCPGQLVFGKFRPAGANIRYHSHVWTKIVACFLAKPLRSLINGLSHNFASLSSEALDRQIPFSGDGGASTLLNNLNILIMFHPIRLAGCLATFLLFFSACQKEPVIKTTPADTSFEVNIDNEFNELQAKYAVFLSDGEGKVRAFRWLPGSDTVHLQAPGIAATDHLDCTIVKLITTEATGSGITDTTLNVRTYANLRSGQNIHLRMPTYQQVTNLSITFTNLTSLDTIIVPDGLGFAVPQPSNNFSGFYRVFHTGKIWVRVKVNGEPNWRYLLLENIAGEGVAVTTDVTTLPIILSALKNISMPFTAAWQYKIEGVIDTVSPHLFPLGDLLRTPGGAVAVFSDFNLFEPNVQPYNGYRISVTGSNSAPGGYTYASDAFYAAVPGSLPVPSFDLEPTVASSERFVAVKCVGAFDLLVLSRSRTGNPNINWEVLTQPTPGIVIYRLPDVPTELSQRFSALGRYNFSAGVRVRAEQYQRLDYEDVIQQLLRNDDPLWQAKAGYLSREEVQ